MIPCYLDKNGNAIKPGMKILMADGSVELVYETTDEFGNPDLGISATNKAFLDRHPDWEQEFYSLSSLDTRSAEICLSEPEIRKELDELEAFIQGTEATVSGMCGTGIIIQGRIVHESIFCKKALSGTEMIPKQYSTPLRHRKLVGLPMENWPLLGLYLTSGTIINPDLPNGNEFCKSKTQQTLAKPYNLITNRRINAVLLLN